MLAGGLCFRSRFALLEPLIGSLLDGCGVGARHAGSEEFRKSFAVLVAGGAGQDGPEVGFPQTRLHAAACPVTRAQCYLSFHISILGGFGEPRNGFPLILTDSIPRGVA